MEKAGPFKLKGTKQWIMYQVWNDLHKEIFLQTLESLKWTDAD
jgi:hypothetical protein